MCTSTSFIRVFFIQEPLVNMLCSVTILGTYQDSLGQSNCTNCPAGHSCTNVASSPVPCPPGTNSSDSDASCTNCPHGTYQNTTGQSVCVDCPAGHSCADRSATPAECLAGTYSLLKDASCTSCPAGSYQNLAGQSACVDCPAGHSCADRSATPVECLAGTFSLLKDASCTNCPDGQYLNIRVVRQLTLLFSFVCLSFSSSLILLLCLLKSLQSASYRLKWKKRLAFI